MALHQTKSLESPFLKGCMWSLQRADPWAAPLDDALHALAARHAVGFGHIPWKYGHGARRGIGGRTTVDRLAVFLLRAARRAHPKAAAVATSCPASTSLRSHIGGSGRAAARPHGPKATEGRVSASWRAGRPPTCLCV